MRFFAYFLTNDVLTWWAAGCSGTVCPYMERFGKGGVSEKSAVFWISHVICIKDDKTWNRWRQGDESYLKETKGKEYKNKGKRIKKIGYIKI
jgi:hypothetical protein